MCEAQTPKEKKEKAPQGVLLLGPVFRGVHVSPPSRAV